MTSPAVGIVTGANKGIGYAIVRKLALQWPTSHLCKLATATAAATNTPAATPVPLLIYLAARNQARGEAAVSAIRADEEVVRAGVLEGGAVDVRYAQLDVASPESIDGFAQHVVCEHPDGIDFLINNAGIAMEGFDANVINTTLGCNYYGLVRTTRALLPNLKPSGRIVNMASMQGMLSRYTPDVAARFRAARTEADVTALMRAFSDAAALGNDEIERAGYPLNRPYGVSKAGVIAFSRALAAELAGAQDQEQSEKRLVNACCPGWVQTDMTKGRGPKTPDQGAETPVMLAIEDIGGRSGGYWTDCKEEEW